MASDQYALRESEAPALLVSADMRVRVANESAHALLGYPPGRLVGAAMSTLFHPRRQAELRNFEQLLTGGGARRWRTALQSYDGKRRDLAISLSARLDSLGAVDAVHVRLEETSIRSASAPPNSSGVHSSVAREVHTSPPTGEPEVHGSERSVGIPSERPTARPPQAPTAVFTRTTPPPGTSMRGQMAHAALEELRSRLVDIEARALPASQPMPAEDRAQLARSVRDALHLLDEAAALVSRDDD